MSSDSEFEPTPPKHRRLTKPLMSNSDDSGSAVHRTLRSGGSNCNKIASDNEDVIELSDDLEIDVSSESGSGNLGSPSNSESPTADRIDTSVANEKVTDSPKRSPESSKNDNKDEAGSSSTGVESDSNDVQAEKCPICWLRFTNQEVASPSTCDHRFCFHCLMEWSKTTNTCPVDRQAFNNITVRPKFGSKSTRLVPVGTRVRTDSDAEWEVTEHDSDDEYYNNYGVEEEDTGPPSADEMDFIEATFSTEEEDEHSSSAPISYQLSSSDDNASNENSVVLVDSSSNEELHSPPPSSECNAISSSSPEMFSFYSPDLSGSSRHSSHSSSSSPICHSPPDLIPSSSSSPICHSPTHSCSSSSCHSHHFSSSSSSCPSHHHFSSSSSHSQLSSPANSPSSASFSSYSSASSASSSSS